MSTTARGVPYPVGSDNNSTTTWMNNLANWVNDNPGIATLTTTARDALAGGELWPGRVIYNTTLKEFQYYTGLAGGQAWAPQGHLRGEIIWLAYKPGTVIPGYLEALGAVVSQTTYSDLYALIGDEFNTGGEGAGNFRLPNMRQRVAVGYDPDDLEYEIGDRLGAQERAVPLLQHSHTMAHTHTINHSHGSTSAQSANHTHGVAITTSSGGAHTHTEKVAVAGSAVQSGGGTNIHNSNVNTNTGSAGTHSHSVIGNTGGVSNNHAHGVPAYSGSSGGVSTGSTGNAGSAGPTLDVRQPSLVLYPLIKY